MSNTRHVWTLLFATMLVLATSVAPARSQEAEQGKGGRRNKAIVGVWLGTTASGGKILQTMNADGTSHRSVQGEVSATSPLGSHTIQHGVWRHLGDRKFAVTYLDIFYDINTGQRIAMGTSNMLIALDADGDAASVRAHVRIVDSSGILLREINGTATLERIEVEKVEWPE